MRTRNKFRKPLRTLDEPSTEVRERVTHRVRTFKRSTAATVLGAAALALALGGLSEPAVSHAERKWDSDSYASCANVALKRMEKARPLSRK
ncbi:hypothetical protein MGAD_05350 [Mycolicibacterium gadium]|uniref:Uncharacterized protein n=1 Tax=Mycolicibacterium gadium TaxID=1794 RepID=A0A7I7WGI1_MYCGU|nr:hypothetical protein MGAD_05350 [Mycolicibacterium gadium]